MNGLVNCFQESDKENLFEKNTNMANLSIPEITKDERVEYRSTLLVEKVFKKNTLENNFMTDKGLFHATSILIDGREYTTYASDLDKTIIGLKGTRGRLELRGKLAGSKFEEILSINDIEKGEEFGGQPAGGKKQNKGIIFEDELYNRLAECIRGTTCKGKYARQAKYILDATSSAIGSPVIDVILEGGRNSPRPLILDGNNPIIQPKEPSGHGELLTDITLKHENGKSSYLSLKFSSTLTFDFFKDKNRVSIISVPRCDDITPECVGYDNEGNGKWGVCLPKFPWTKTVLEENENNPIGEAIKSTSECM